MRAIPLYRFVQRYVRRVKDLNFTSLPGTMVLCTGMYGAADLSRQYITEGRNCKLDTTSASNMAMYVLCVCELIHKPTVCNHSHTNSGLSSLITMSYGNASICILRKENTLIAITTVRCVIALKNLRT